MARNKLLQATLATSADDTEQRFYDALQTGDIDRLMACWAEDDEVACAGVDGVRVHGLAEVRGRFEALLAQGGVDVRPVVVRRMNLGGSSLHHVLEQVRSQGAAGEVGYVIATNAYVNTPQGWRLVLHHASAGTAAELDPNGPDSQLGNLLH